MRLSTDNEMISGWGIKVGSCRRLVQIELCMVKHLTSQEIVTHDYTSWLTPPAEPPFPSFLI